MKPQFFFHHTTKRNYLVGEVKCETCKESIQDTAVLREFFFKDKKPIRQFFCTLCVTKKKSGVYSEAVRVAILTILPTMGVLPPDSIPMSLKPPVLQWVRNASLFDLALKDGDGVITDVSGCKWSFRKQCEEIDLEHREQLLDERTKELNAPVTNDFFRKTMAAKRTIDEPSLEKEERKEIEKKREEE